MEKTRISLTIQEQIILSKSEKIVVYMMRSLLDEGRHVVTDNWYTSLRLANYLENRNTTITGVVRRGRGPPKEITQLPLEKHQRIFARKGNVLIVRWQDKRDITVMTTKYQAGMVEKVREYFGNQTVFYNKPLHIDMYNKKMGSVDKADQFLEPYVFDRKSFGLVQEIRNSLSFSDGPECISCMEKELQQQRRIHGLSRKCCERSLERAQSRSIKIPTESGDKTTLVSPPVCQVGENRQKKKM